MQEIMTIPDYFKLRKPGPFTPPGPGGVRDVFRQTGDRDPLPMFAHESIGHDLDAQRLQHDTRPIRGVPRTPRSDGCISSTASAPRRWRRDSKKI